MLQRSCADHRMSEIIELRVTVCYLPKPRDLESKVPGTRRTIEIRLNSSETLSFRILGGLSGALLRTCQVMQGRQFSAVEQQMLGCSRARGGSV